MLQGLSGYLALAFIFQILTPIFDIEFFESNQSKKYMKFFLNLHRVINKTVLEVYP